MRITVIGARKAWTSSTPVGDLPSSVYQNPTQSGYPGAFQAVACGIPNGVVVHQNLPSAKNRPSRSYSN